MNLIAVSFAAVIVVLIAIKIKDMDSGYGVILSMAGCVMGMYFVVRRFRQDHSIHIGKYHIHRCYPEDDRSCICVSVFK